MATRSLGTLTLDLVAKLGGFEQGMDKAARLSEKQMARISDAAHRAGEQIGTALKIGAAAFAASAAGLAVLTKNAISTAASLDDLKQKTGVAVQTLSALQYAADMEGIESFDADLVKFSRSLGESIKQTSEQAKAFAQLGVRTTNADGTLRKLDDVLLDVAEAYSQLPDGVQKANNAMALFGKSGAGLITFLNKGRSGLRELTDEAARLGVVIDDDAAAAAADFEDNLFRVRRQLNGIANQIAVQALPVLKQWSEKLSDPAVQASVKNIAMQVGNTVDKIVSAAPTILKLLAALKGAQVGASIGRVFGPWGMLAGVAVGGGAGFLGAKAATDSLGEFADGLKTSEQRARELDAQLKTLDDTAAMLRERLHSGVSGREGTIAEDAKNLDIILKQLEKLRGAESKAPAAPRAWGDLPDLSAMQKQREQVERMIEALADQAATLGYNARAMDLYRAAAAGASDADFDLINQLHDKIDAWNEGIEASRRFQQQLEEQTQALANIEPPPAFAGIDALIGGAAGELEKFNEATRELEAWYEKQLAVIDKYRDERIAVIDGWDAKEEELKRQHEDRMLAIEKARSVARQQLAMESFSYISSLATAHNKKLAAIGKAAAIAEATIDGVVAVQKALKSAAPPYNYVLAAAVGVAAANNVAQIAGVGFAKGGYTGNIGRGQVAGVVHGQEYVFDAAATARLGVENLEALRKGFVPPEIDMRMPALPERATKVNPFQIVNNAPGVTLSVAQGVLTVDMLPELIEVASGRARVLVAEDARDLRSPLSQNLQRVHRTQGKADR